MLRPREGEEQITCAHCGHAIALKLDEATGAIVAAHTGPPAGTRVVVDRSRPDQITIRIPHSRRVRWIFQAVLYLALVIVIVHVFLVEPEGPMAIDLVSACISILGIVLTNLHAQFGGTRVRVDADQFSVTKSLFGIPWRREGRTSQILSIELRQVSDKEDDQTPLQYTAAVAIRTRRQNYRFGFFLSPIEKVWIARELRVFLREVGHPVD